MHTHYSNVLPPPKTKKKKQNKYNIHTHIKNHIIKIQAKYYEFLQKAARYTTCPFEIFNGW